jgi:hypothetical protein
MALFGETAPDPRDSEIQFLRGLVKTLQDQLVALTDARAHAVLTRPAPQARPVKEPTQPKVYGLTEDALHDIEAQFALADGFTGPKS